jgi:hypothetical protein
VGSLTFDGIRFQVYSSDHPPPHVHATAHGVVVVIELIDGSSARIADRKDAVLPNNAKRSDVKKIVKCAIAHSALLMKLWEMTHETPS